MVVLTILTLFLVERIDILCTGQCLSQDLDFFFPKKELFKFVRELFAKERSYPSTTKLHNEARKQVRSSYITCTEYTKQNIVPS